ncbi:MAG: YHYH protein [Chloroflexi bacterium]|nr:MAG: YHYH protein [Chloroflexota bacterium]
MNKFGLLIVFFFITLIIGCAGGSSNDESLLAQDVSVEASLESTSTPTPQIVIQEVKSEQVDSLIDDNQEQAISDAQSTTRNSNFTITSTLCEEKNGPDCSKLRLGDDYHTTSIPTQKGYLYSCHETNPNAPGSIESKITWIDFVENVWNFFKKPWLPEGEFTLETGMYTETISAGQRQININNLPVDGKMGDWPMTNYATLTEIDRNPGIPRSSQSEFTYPSNPSKSLSPTCVSLGAIGVTKNGVVIFNASDGRGEDAVAREIVDVFGGHPARDEYHYHFIPERLDNEYLSDGHSGIVGYINDGFPIYGYRGRDGVEMSNTDLDLCHGHEHGELGYHYHATMEYPYTVGCYVGNTVLNSPN